MTRYFRSYAAVRAPTFAELSAPIPKANLYVFFPIIPISLKPSAVVFEVFCYLLLTCSRLDHVRFQNCKGLKRSFGLYQERQDVHAECSWPTYVSNAVNVQRINTPAGRESGLCFLYIYLRITPTLYKTIFRRFQASVAQSSIFHVFPFFNAWQWQW